MMPSQRSSLLIHPQDTLHKSLSAPLPTQKSPQNSYKTISKNNFTNSFSAFFIDNPKKAHIFVQS